MDCSTPGSPVLHYLLVSSNSCPLSWLCYLTISSSATPFPFCPQSFPASGSFPVSGLFTSGGQRIGASALASVLPVNIHGWFPLGWTGLTPCSAKASQESSLTLKFKSINSSALSLSYGPALTSVHDYRKTIGLTIWTSVVPFSSCPQSLPALDSILKSRDITLLRKVHLVKAMVFPVVMYGVRVGL